MSPQCSPTIIKLVQGGCVQYEAWAAGLLQQASSEQRNRNAVHHAWTKKYHVGSAATLSQLFSLRSGDTALRRFFQASDPGFWHRHGKLLRDATTRCDLQLTSARAQ